MQSCCCKVLARMKCAGEDRVRVNEGAYGGSAVVCGCCWVDEVYAAASTNEFMARVSLTELCCHTTHSKVMLQH